MNQLERVQPDFDLAKIDPASTPGFVGGKRDAVLALTDNGARLGDLQERLYAESKFGGTRRVLLVLQGMDTSGKGGIIRHVIGGTDPQGVALHSFKAPSVEEREHDFLWRIRAHLPGPGILGVFDRSHYEDVLIHRVRGLSTPEVIEARYGIISDFEKDLVLTGTTIVKVLLHVSSAAQKARLTERLARPEKNWKFNPGDTTERQKWDAYQEAYQIALARTSTSDAPWFVVPADHKWYARWAVQHLLLTAMSALNPHWPTVDYDVAAEQERLAAT